MAKSKFDQHLEDLEKNTSGGSHDSIVASGKGLTFLRSLFKASKKPVDDDEDEFDDENEDELDDDDLDDDDDDNMKRGKKTKKNANGGDFDEEDEDPDDPADDDDSIISNHGKRTSKKKLSQAVSKSFRDFDEDELMKSMDAFEYENEELLDATPALEELAYTVRIMAKNVGTGMSDLQNTVLVLAKGLEQSLKAQAALAADMELIKKQPATSPASGFVLLNKQQGKGKEKKLSKSAIEDALTDAMNNDHEDAPMLLAKLGSIRNNTELKSFVDNLPSEIQELL